MSSQSPTKSSKNMNDEPSISHKIYKFAKGMGDEPSISKGMGDEPSISHKI